MKTAEQMITEYEIARVEISTLGVKRCELMELCKISCFFTGSCFTRAWDEFCELSAESPNTYGFHEVMSNMDEDEVCPTCLQAYELKIGPIAAAKQKFGQAKRAISARAKMLIQTK